MTMSVQERGHHQHAGDPHRDVDQQGGLLIGDRHARTGIVRLADRLLGQSAQRVARRVVGPTRIRHIEVDRLGLVVLARQLQHAVDDVAIIMPALPELGVELGLVGIVVELFVAVLRLRDRAVEFDHLDLDRGDLA
jgi:hypothetical protein